MNTESTLRTSTPLKNDEQWLCIHFDQFALDLTGLQSSSTELPHFIYHENCVWQVNQAASARGIVAGMSVDQALSLIDTSEAVTRVERNILLEQRRLLELAFWAYKFSSQVCVFSECSLLLEVGKSERLFGGFSSIIDQCNKDLSMFGYECSLSIASTPLAAYVLRSNPNPSRRGQSALGRASLELLPVSSKTLFELKSCGFKVLNDIVDIPITELGTRFGSPFKDSLERVYGLVFDPQIPVSPPEHFNKSVSFAEPISTISWIEEQIYKMLYELAQFTQQRQLLCGSIVWSFRMDQPRMHHELKIDLGVSLGAAPTLDGRVDSLFELTQIKLERQDFKFEFSHIELLCDDLTPLALFTGDLFNDTQNDASFESLKEKLAARLGDKAVYKLMQKSEVLPERRHAKVNTSISDVRALDNADELTQNEPLWLFQAPTPLSAHHNKPLYESSPLDFVHGPQRLVSEWWLTLQSRDYYIARTTDGQLLWVFYDRVDKTWYLHGLYG